MGRRRGRAGENGGEERSGGEGGEGEDGEKERENERRRRVEERRARRRVRGADIASGDEPDALLKSAPQPGEKWVASK